MNDPIHLRLGMTVWYHGQEYEIAGFQLNETPDGQSVQIQCLEPLYATRNRMDSEMRREAARTALETAKRVNKRLDEEDAGDAQS